MLYSVLPNSQRNFHRHVLLANLLLLFLLLCWGPAAQASGVVSVPTEAALDAALVGGGSVTFACDGVIPITSTKQITSTTSLDAAGHNITLDGGNRIQLFQLGTSSTPLTLAFTLNNLTLANGRSDYGGGAIEAFNIYLLIITNCTFTGNVAVHSTGSVGDGTGSAGGGAVSIGAQVDTDSTAMFSNCKFVNNSAIGATIKQPKDVSAGGGAIDDYITRLLVTNCVFLNNTAQGGNIYGASNPGFSLTTGGAISSSLATVDINNTTFWGNKSIGGIGYDGAGSQANGGALDFRQSTSTTITDCTFAYNRAHGGSAILGNGGNAVGGAFTTAGPFQLVNCTLSNNQSVGGDASSAAYRGGFSEGGGFEASPNLTYTTVLDCTIANNSALGGQAGGLRSGNGYGGGLYSVANGSLLTLSNTIVANNTASTAGNNANGTLADAGYNLCSDASCAFTQSTSKNNTDPRLASLANNGGLTPTRALLPGSPALRAGHPFSEFDQRGWQNQPPYDIGSCSRRTWQADAIAVGPDNNTRLLWNRADGLCNLWSVDANGNVAQSFDFGPFPGWAAVAISVGADNNTRLLWQHSSGAVNVWNVDTSTGSGGVLASVHYGPFAGWTLNSLATGADNNTRLLWTNLDGHIDLWNVDTGSGTDAATLLSSSHYGPYADWTASGLAVGSDNSTRLLWTNFDGRANVWNVTTGTGVDAATILFSAHYGPYPGWIATTLSVGADNNTRLLWTNFDGRANVWNLQIGAGVDNSVLLSSPTYGPFHGQFSNFGCNALSVGGDNQPRLLWNNIAGMLDLWRVNEGGGLLSSFHFGPF